MKKLVLLICLMPFLATAQDISIYDSLTFEEQPVEGLYLDADTLSQWQVGKPGKTVFTNAINGNTSVVTDTVDTYVPGITSAFSLNILKYLGYNSGGLMWYDVHFVHSMNCDSLAGGYIEISYDSVRWYNIAKQDSIFQNFGAEMMGYWGDESYDKILPNGETGFSGNFNNKQFNFSFGVMPIKQGNEWIAFNPPFLRFTFISDSLSTAADGWMLDGFYLQASAGGSVNETLSRSIKTYPNPVTDRFAFEVDENRFKPVKYNITNMLGQQITGGNINTKYINTDALPAGAYIVTLTDKEGNSGAKLFYKQ